MKVQILSTTQSRILTDKVYLRGGHEDRAISRNVIFFLAWTSNGQTPVPAYACVKLAFLRPVVLAVGILLTRYYHASTTSLCVFLFCAPLRDIVARLEVLS